MLICYWTFGAVLLTIHVFIALMIFDGLIFLEYPNLIGPARSETALKITKKLEFEMTEDEQIAEYFSKHEISLKFLIFASFFSAFWEISVVTALVIIVAWFLKNYYFRYFGTI